MRILARAVITSAFPFFWLHTGVVQGALTNAKTADQVGQRIQAEVAMWAKVIKGANIKRA